MFSANLVHRHIIFLLTPLLLEKMVIISPDNALYYKHFREGMYRKQKRQDCDHKAYNAPSAIIIMCMSPLHWVTAQYMALGALYYAL